MSNTDGTCEYVLDPDDPETWGGDEGDGCYVDEKNLNKEGVWTCPHTSIDNKDKCIFHTPTEEKKNNKVIEEFLNIINDIDDSVDEGEILTRQFIGSQFEKFDISDSNIGPDSNCILNFKHSEFSSTININNNILNFSLVMDGTEFGRGVNITNNEINGDLSFINSDVAKHICFNDSEINGEVSFGGCVISRSAEFKRVTIDENVNCAGARIDGELSFNGSAISDSVVCRDANLLGGVDFEYADIGDIVWLINAQVHEEICLDNLSVDGELSFYQAEVNGPLRLVDANITGSVDFQETKLQSGQFEKITINGDAKFSELIANGSFSFAESEFLGDANFEGATFKNSVNFRGVDLTDSTLNHIEAKEADFQKADLTDADIMDGNIQDSNLERAKASRCDFFGSNLKGVAFYGSLIGDAQINERTKFGDRCVYDPEFEDEPDTDIVDDDTGRLTKAAGQYRIIEQLARTNAFPDMVSHNFIRRQDIHREQHKQEGRWGRWLRATASKYVLEYGENPWRLIATGLIIVVGFGLLYPLVGGLQPTGGSPITASRVIENPLLLAQSIYYSTLTFTTLGMGDFLPVGLGRVLTTIETSLGAIIIALLVFVFGRRAAR